MGQPPHLLSRRPRLQRPCMLLRRARHLLNDLCRTVRPHLNQRLLQLLQQCLDNAHLRNLKEVTTLVLQQIITLAVALTMLNSILMLKTTDMLHLRNNRPRSLMTPAPTLATLSSLLRRNNSLLRSKHSLPHRPSPRHLDKHHHHKPSHPENQLLLLPSPAPAEESVLITSTSWLFWAKVISERSCWLRRKHPRNCTLSRS